MKYVITGGAGNISKPLALQLLTAGHAVTVIGRSEGNLKELTDAGAKAAIGSVEDLAFLTAAFFGAAFLAGVTFFALAFLVAFFSICFTCLFYVSFYAS